MVLQRPCQTSSRLAALEPCIGTLHVYSPFQDQLFLHSCVNTPNVVCRGNTLRIWLGQTGLVPAYRRWLTQLVVFQSRQSVNSLVALCKPQIEYVTAYCWRSLDKQLAKLCSRLYTAQPHWAKVTLILKWSAHFATRLLHYSASHVSAFGGNGTSLQHQTMSLNRLCVLFLFSIQFRDRCIQQYHGKLAPFV